MTTEIDIEEVLRLARAAARGRVKGRDYDGKNVRLDLCADLLAELGVINPTNAGKRDWIEGRA